MRESLRIAVKNAIFFECRLPDKASGLGRSCLSSHDDSCFKNNDHLSIARVIYNGIVEYAVNEYNIDYENLELEQRRAIARYIRYDANASDATKLKYGFYGEVLLDLILRCFMNTSVLLARGYFYSVLEGSEPKGFDAFHIIEQNERLDLWFGEAKFHQNYKQAITQVLEKIHLSLSDEYVNKNLVALIDWQDRFTTPNSQIENILHAWEDNPTINLTNEMNSRNMRLTYPIFIAYEKTDALCYHNNIKDCIKYIKEQVNNLNISIPATFDYRIFFIFLPVNEVKQIKERVLDWIEKQEPLI